MGKQQSTDPLQGIYNDLGMQNAGVDFDSFKKTFNSNPDARKSVYNDLGLEKAGVGYDVFEEKLGLKKKDLPKGSASGSQTSGAPSAVSQNKGLYGIPLDQYIGEDNAKRIRSEVSGTPSPFKTELKLESAKKPAKIGYREDGLQGAFNENITGPYVSPLEREQSDKLRKVVQAYQGPKTLLKPSEEKLSQGYADEDLQGNKAGYLYNEILKGVGDIASGAGDVLTNLASYTQPQAGPRDRFQQSAPLTKEQQQTQQAIVKEYREQTAPTIRNYLKDAIGSNVDKRLENKYGRQTFTGALGGLARSAPSIALNAVSGGLGGASMFLQSYDNALESINSTPEGRNLDEATKTFFAGGVGLATSALEKYSLDRILGEATGPISNAITKRALQQATRETGGKVTGDVLTNFINKEVINLSNRFVKGGAHALDGALTEYTTEALQEGAQAGSELLVNKATGKPVFDTSEIGNWKGFLGRMNRAGVMGAIGGGLLGGVAGLAGIKKGDIDQKEQSINEINTALQSPDISEVAKEVLVQNKIKLQDELDVMSEKIDNAYDKLDPSQKEQVNKLVEDKVKLQEAIADPGIPESVKKSLTEQSDAVDNEISKIKSEKTGLPSRDVFKEYDEELQFEGIRPMSDQALEVMREDFSKRYGVEPYDQIFDRLKKESEKGKGFFAKMTSSDQPIRESTEKEFRSNIEKAIDEEQKQSKSKEPISDEVYDDFVDKGAVPETVLDSIAKKVKNKETLTERENAIFTDKTGEINDIIAKEQPLKKQQYEKDVDESMGEKPYGQKNGPELKTEGRVEKGTGEGQKSASNVQQEKEIGDEGKIGERGTIQGSRGVSKKVGGEEPSGGSRVSGNEEVRKGQNAENGTGGTQEEIADGNISTQVLKKAEDDLASLKQTEQKSKKYDASMRRLSDAKANGEISAKEFDGLKQRFDDVMAESNIKIPKIKEETKDAVETREIEQGSIAERAGTAEQQQGRSENRADQEESVAETKTETSSGNRIEESGEKQLSAKEKIVDIETRRQSIKERISEKLKAQRGQLSSGFDPSLLKDFIELGSTYIEEGIVKASDFIKRFREDYKEFGYDDNDITDTEIREQIFDKVNEQVQKQQTEADIKEIGLTKEDVQNLRAELGQEQFANEVRSNAERIAEAKRLIDEGYNIKDLTNKLGSDTGYLPNATEVEILKQYYSSLTEKINKEPSPELLKQRDDFLKTVDATKVEQGRSIQAWDGLTKLEDNLANFLTEESQFVDLSQEQIKDLSEKYNKAKEALTKLQAIQEQALADARNKKALSNIERAKREAERTGNKKLVKEAYREERKQFVADFRAELRKIRTSPSAVILPYQRELIALAPFARKMVQSYVSEGIYDLKQIISGIHKEFSEDLPELTENDVRDIIAGEYRNPRETKNAKLAQIHDLQRQAKLEMQIENLRNGIVETKNPVKKRRNSEEIEALLEEIKAIKKRNPELTYPSKLETRKTWLKNRIEELKEDIRKGNFEPIEEPVPVLLDQEALKLKDEYIKFKEETRARRQHQEEQSLKGIDKVLKRLQELAATKRLVQTSIDLSIPLRQGITVMLNPRTIGIGSEAYAKMISSVKSEKNYDRMMFDIEQSPKYLESKDDGIVYNEVGSLNPEKRDEFHRDHFLYKAPVLGKLLKASERAASAWTNYARYELYLRGAKTLEAQGKTRENAKKAYEDMAARVMVDTGRGKLPGISDKQTSKEGAFIKKVLGNTLYGARLASAVFRKLNPLYYLNPKVDRTVRIEALKDMAGYTTGVIATALVARALGYATSLDWDDPDFLKLRKGKEVIDITGGQATYIRTFMRLVNATYNQADPTVSAEDAKKYSKFAKQSLETFWRNKLAPNTSYAVNAFMGENTIGEKFDPWEIVKIYPMYTDDIIKSFKEGSPLDLVTIIPISISGLGYQTYEKDIRKAKLNYHIQDKALMKFLGDHQLNITGSINQEVYDPERGEKTRMTDAQSDRYEKIWADYIIDELNANKSQLDKLSPEKLKKEISKIKSEANKYAKYEISGVQEGITTITHDGTTYELTPEEVKQRNKINREYIQDNGEDIKNDWTEKYIEEDGMSRKRASKKAVLKIQSLANSYSGKVIINMQQENNDGKIMLKEKQPD